MADDKKSEPPIGREDAIAMLKAGKVKEWNALREAHPDWDVLPLLGERIVDLSGASLDFADLPHVNLIELELSEAKLFNANLTHATLSGATLRAGTLVHARLGGAELIGTGMQDAKLSRADLSGANLRAADLTGASLTCADLSDADVSDVIYVRSRMRGRYRGVRADSCYGNALFKRDAQDQDFIDTLEAHWMDTWKKHKVREFWRPACLFIWRYGTDYGRGIFRVALGALFMALWFGLSFALCNHYGTPCNSPIIHYAPQTPDNWFTPFYYSIVTYTTLGFGDVTPCDWQGQVLVTFEVIFGYITLGLLISILANKVARRA